jgi:membrane dipeptidase
MKLFDLHCDTIGECYKNKLSLRHSGLHVSLDKAKNFESYTQVFAVWIPDELRGKSATDYFNNVCDYYYKELELNKDLIVSFDDAKKDDKRVKAILAIEGGAALAGDFENLYKVYEKGVRILTLTWNAENEIASGAFCENGGLTSFGKTVIKKMEKLKMVIDVSHLNRESFFDVAENTTLPFIASHSNPDIVETNAGRKRNLTDEQIEIIKERKGLIGLNFYKEFLDVDNKTGVDALKVHLDYLLNKGCENIIALGLDFDGCDLSDGITGLESMDSVYNSLINDGFSKTLIDNMFCYNAERFFRKV